ncbi:hypothetical protein MesoLj113a_44630 [Mesorhizobium sp. 113-1-2]|nr:Putative signal transduction histidine kinase [Mesorhizobium loti]BCG73305.1 hypothetical protein MesoLj113a_44630 [Mesorhizobium sp. 113-1-2]
MQVPDSAKAAGSEQARDSIPPISASSAAALGPKPAWAVCKITTTEVSAEISSAVSKTGTGD